MVNALFPRRSRALVGPFYKLVWVNGVCEKRLVKEDDDGDDDRSGDEEEDED